MCVCVCFFYDCESSPGRTNVCTCAFMAAWASVAKCISILAYSHKSIRKTKTKQIMQKQGTRCLSYYMECAAECPPKAQNGTPDGAFPQIGHISLLYLAGKQNTERVWKVEAEAEHQGEQANILFFPLSFPRVAVARGFLSVPWVLWCYKLCITALWRKCNAMPARVGVEGLQMQNDKLKKNIQANLFCYKCVSILETLPFFFF